MDHDVIRNKARVYYQTIGKVFSPALNEFVSFSRPGFRHIIFRRWRKRSRAVQKARFALLPLAVKLIGLSTTHQEFEEMVSSQNIRYWGIIAILENKKFKVIIRRVGENGTLHFWSVIPEWKTSPRRDRKFFKNSGSPTKTPH